VSRTLSTLAKQAIFAQESGETFLLLLTISHASLATPIRLVADMQDVVSRGNTFTALPFGFVLPGEREDQIPRCRLWVDNVDRAIVTAIRNATGSPPTLLAEIVIRAQPDTLEASFDGYTLRDADYDVVQVSGDLSLEDPLNEPYPADSFTPNLFPAVF
jgi:hypothetical protein